jgi:hypothetical protein
MVSQAEAAVVSGDVVGWAMSAQLPNDPAARAALT